MPAPSNPRPQAMPPARRFAVLGGLARGTEKGGRRGTQGNGGWGNPNGMNVGWGIGGGGAEEILRSTPEEVIALYPDQEFREKAKFREVGFWHSVWIIAGDSSRRDDNG